ncbi:LOW QUALITY PROTEIN: hypothetical protein V2J09_018989 [Rumex salicifolius]
MLKNFGCLLLLSGLLLSAALVSSSKHGNPANDIVEMINKNRTDLKLRPLSDSPGLGCMALQYATECVSNCTQNNTVNCHPSPNDFTEVFAPNCGVELPTFTTISGHIVGCNSDYLSPSNAYSTVLMRDGKSVSLMKNKTHTEVGVGFVRAHGGRFIWCVLFSNGETNSSFVLDDQGQGIKQRKGCFSGVNSTCSKANKLVNVALSCSSGFFTAILLQFILIGVQEAVEGDLQARQPPYLNDSSSSSMLCTETSQPESHSQSQLSHQPSMESLQTEPVLSSASTCILRSYRNFSTSDLSSSTSNSSSAMQKTWIVQLSKLSLLRRSLERSNMRPPSLTIQYRSIVPYCLWNMLGHSSRPLTMTTALLATIQSLIMLTNVAGISVRLSWRHISGHNDLCHSLTLLELQEFIELLSCNLRVFSKIIVIAVQNGHEYRHSPSLLLHEAGKVCKFRVAWHIFGQLSPWTTQNEGDWVPVLGMNLVC